MKACAYPNCKRNPKYYMGWNNENGKHSGLVCATHDRILGRTNLTGAGMSVRETILFERYLKETVNLEAYPDWPEWLKNYLNDKVRPVRKDEELIVLNLPPRTFNALHRRQITLDELIDMSTEELLKIRWIGKSGIAAIQKALKEYESG